MNIGLDISQIVYKGTGVARFTEGLVNAIIKYDTNNTWTFVFFGLRQQPEIELVDQIRNSRHRLIRKPIPPTLLSTLHNTVHKYTSLLTFANIPVKTFDWFITSDWTEPHIPCKKATIVHDLVFKRYPETVHRRIREVQEERLAWIAKETSLIFVDSRATGADLKQHYLIADKKIVVNYPGINFEILQPADQVTFEELRSRYALPAKFMLTVGKLEPRKNIPRLLEAYSKIETDIGLVIAGMEGWGNIPHTEDKRVLFPGYVSDDELKVLYKHALGFVYPSLYEGFGYPVVEAMRYGCPVLTSDTSSLSEIAGDAALFCDPLDTKSIQTGLEQIINDKELRTALIIKGKEQAATYTWERYYNTLISSLGAGHV